MSGASMRNRNAPRKGKGTVRRSIAVPAELLEEAVDVAGAAAAGNVNEVIRMALHVFVEERRRGAFAEEMSAMAQDDDVSRASAGIERAFRRAERDGL